MLPRWMPWWKRYRLVALISSTGSGDSEIRRLVGAKPFSFYYMTMGVSCSVVQLPFLPKIIADLLFIREITFIQRKCDDLSSFSDGSIWVLTKNISNTFSDKLSSSVGSSLLALDENMSRVPSTFL